MSDEEEFEKRKVLYEWLFPPIHLLQKQGFFKGNASQLTKELTFFLCNPEILEEELKIYEPTDQNSDLLKTQ